MFLPKIYAFIEKLSKKMTCESAKCYSTAIYTTIMVVLSLQLLGTIEKQVFDFLGYMWAPIIGNFFQIICTILGIFGTYQYRPKFIAAYSTWSLIWLGWNIFVICLYLEVGVLNRDRQMYILSIGTKSKSWWLEHGIGCKISNDSWVETAASNTGRKIPPEEFVEGCILAYYYVEVIHAGVQCLLALTGFVFSLMAIYIYSEEQESCKYPSRTYTSPSDYPTTQYASLGVVQNARNSSGQPIYVTYAESLEWPRTEDVENNKNCDGSGQVNTCQGTKGGHSYNDFMTGSARMRNCENGVVDQSIYSSRAYNSGRLWEHNTLGEGTENVSAV